MEVKKFVLKVLVFLGLFAVLSFGYSFQSKAQGYTTFNGQPVPWMSTGPMGAHPAYFNGMGFGGLGYGFQGQRIWSGPHNGAITNPSGYSSSCLMMGACGPGNTYGSGYLQMAQPMFNGWGQPGYGSGYYTRRYSDQQGWNWWAQQRSMLASNPYHTPNWPSPLMQNWAYTGQQPTGNVVAGGVQNILTYPVPPPLPSSHFGTPGGHPIAQPPGGTPAR